MTADEIKQARDVIAKMTSGPWRMSWEQYQFANHQISMGYVRRDDGTAFHIRSCDTDTIEANGGDGHGIAYLQNNATAWLDEIERLQWEEKNSSHTIEILLAKTKEQSEEIERLRADVHDCPTCGMACKQCECSEKEIERLRSELAATKRSMDVFDTAAGRAIDL